MSDVRLRQHIITLARSPKIDQYSPEAIVRLLKEQHLLKIQKFMRSYSRMNVVAFLRLFREILRDEMKDQFYLTYGIMQLFKQLCMLTGRPEVTFMELSSLVTDKLPGVRQDLIIKEKIYPSQLDLSDALKEEIETPEVIGKVIQQREKLEERPYLADSFAHLNRIVGQTQYSAANQMFLTMDIPSVEVRLLDEKFKLTKSIGTTLDISNRDAVITYMAWSETEQRLACILGNYSISIWSLQDNFRYEVNVPLSPIYLSAPFVMLQYMESEHCWYALDNRPTIYILKSRDFEPKHEISNMRMVKRKETERVLLKELKYRKLICLAFERNLFLVSLGRREIVAHLCGFKTGVTSIAFSECFQVLFVSTFAETFSAYELSQQIDLTERGKFEGHRHLVSLVGTLQGRPVVYSLDESSNFKVWDIRDLTCYQTFSVLLNITFSQIIALPQSICLVGSKLYQYRWTKPAQTVEKEKLLLIDCVDKNILLVTNRCVKLVGHSNGRLLKILKGAFQSTEISFAYVLHSKRLLYLIDDVSETCIYSTKDFTLHNRMQLKPGTVSIHFDSHYGLLSVCSQEMIEVSQYISDQVQSLKRTFKSSSTESFRFCRMSSPHDLIVTSYEQSEQILFTSYERGKVLGCLLFYGVFDVSFVQQKAMLVLLCREKITFLSYRRFATNMSFFIRKSIDLWNKMDFERYVWKDQTACLELHSTYFFFFKDSFQSKSYSFFASESGSLEPMTRLIVTSNVFGLQCIIDIDYSALAAQPLKPNHNNYNPYRISHQVHKRDNDHRKSSLLVQENMTTFFKQKYICLLEPREYSVKTVGVIGNYYAVGNQELICFYDRMGSQRARISTAMNSLPISWNISNYSEEELKGIKFVLDFINNENKLNHKEGFDLDGFTASQQNHEELTVSKIIKQQKPAQGIIRSHSLRETKRVLEREREERERQENYIQHCKTRESKLKEVMKATNDKYVNESVTYLTGKRNHLFLRGKNVSELPTVDALERKLEGVVKEDKGSPKTKIFVPETAKTAESVDFLSTKRLKSTSLLLPLGDSLRERLFRLSQNLKRSKMSNRGVRNGERRLPRMAA